ncbi:MAG TPA: aldehyde dehydrogenase family protein, partial [Planctomycetota bacterium]|nr:aldehyde dehydrogenase family protein [Planctomycetota bacterium]
MVLAPDSKTLVSIDPATERPVGEVPIASESDVRAAVDGARRAQPAWAARPIESRAAILLRAAELLEGRAEEFARLVTREEGKILSESRAEAKDAAARIRYFAEVGPRHLASREERAPGVRGLVEYVPIGVVAAIKPWNFPVQIPLWTIAPALLAGNAVVLKPSELTPLVGDALARLFHEAGVPPAVLAVVQGADEVGAALVRAPVDMIGFVGSQAAGSSIASQAGRDLKRV